MYFARQFFGVYQSNSHGGPTNQGKKNGANDRNRTDDLFITSELLYRLSYIGITCLIIYTLKQYLSNLC